VRCTPNQICGQSSNPCQELRTVCTRDGERCEPRNKSNGTNCGEGPRCASDSQIKLQDKCMGGQCTSPTMNCPNNQRCEAAGNSPRCVPNCISECTPGDRRCQSPGDINNSKFDQCVNVNGCGVWRFGGELCPFSSENGPQFACQASGSNLQCVCLQMCP
jgi:hypothetical protein